MFSPSCGSSSPFSLTDLDMWDTKSHFTAQTSAWCGMATVSGAGFLSKVNTSSTGGFRQKDPGLKRWQSLSHLTAGNGTRSFSPSGSELKAARAGGSFREAEAVHWLQDAHERLDTQLDRLRARNTQLSYNITAAHLLDMKHKLSDSMSTLEQGKEAAELPQFEKRQQRGELHEKVLKLEKDLLQMKSALDRGSNDQPTEKAPGSLSSTSPVSQEEFNEQEKLVFDSELYELREALKEAESRAKKQEEERNKALQHLQSSKETQKRLLNQIEEMNERISHTVQNHSEVQGQLCEANNKISQSCLERAVLSTQVLKLEENIKDLQAKLTGAMTDKDHLIQEKADLLQRAEELERTHHCSEVCDLYLANADSHNNNQVQEAVLTEDNAEALREVNEKLRGDLETIRKRLEISECQLKELTEEKVLKTKHVAHLETRCSQLIREKEELLSKINDGEPAETKERESVEVLELENQKLRDQYLCLEAEVLERENLLRLQEEEYRKQDEARVQSIEELKAVASHWTEKWQKVALTLQSTREELEEFKRNSSRNERESDSLRAELDACKQDLEMERSRHRYGHKDKAQGGSEAVQTQDKQTATDLSESSLLWEQPSDTKIPQSNSPQVCVQSSEVERLKQKLVEREKELRDSEHALKSLQRLRELDKTEAQNKISALEFKLMKKVSGDHRDDKRLQPDFSVPDSLRLQLDESRRQTDQLQREKMLAVEKLRTLRQLCPVKEETPSVEGGRDKTVCPANVDAEQQRRMVTEQLKSLFKERGEKGAGKVDNTSAAAVVQNRTPSSKAVRAPVEWRNWQRVSGLTPVVEEDEESSDMPGEEEMMI
ncbi:myosin-2 heavy chain-like [Mugil cephalus]|uniref:myosin-2 heavy chain-like n=1 Tax=Mugil cephalus TaxID=48193 RepID=UPI001FB60144|nr:myosin-2 heavy chain-like [Mugil cephalus]